jgi:hypothetical protein
VELGGGDAAMRRCGDAAKVDRVDRVDVVDLLTLGAFAMAASTPAHCVYSVHFRLFAMSPIRRIAPPSSSPLRSHHKTLSTAPDPRIPP